MARIRNLLFLGAIVLALCLVAVSGWAQGQSTEVINYQGKLTNAAGVSVNGTVTASFALFDTGTPAPGQNPLWEEREITVDVLNGIYNVELGSHIAFPEGLFHIYEDLYLRVTVDGEAMTPLQHLTATAYAMKALHADTAASVENGMIPDDLYIDGRLGIGTDSPRTDLEIQGTSGLRVTTGQHNNVFGEFKHGYSQGLIINANAGGGWADMRFQTDGTDRMFIESAGNVGIGTTTPATKLDVVGTAYVSGRLGIGTTSPDTKLEINGNGSSWAEGFLSIKNEGEDAGIRIYDSDTDVKHHIFNDTHYFDSLRICPAGTYTNGGITITQGGNVGIGTGLLVPTSRLTVAGSIKLTGGSDLSEPFKFNRPGLVKPGMIVSIDPERSGELKPASSPYDRCVAGIVSGAGGVRPGLLMMQQDTLEGDHQVALVGRVYGLCDASYGSIKPGDLLTTSPTPGYAMKVTDYNRAQGAILGKAMTKLEKGKALVLVLVGLQ